MAGIMCQVLPIYFKNLSSNCLFISISIEKFTQYLVTEQYCVARHNDFCPIEKCKSHVILISDFVEDILENWTIIFILTKQLTVFTRYSNISSATLW